ncbi:HNH endonuclease (plasmid) [Burkholderia ambifaria]
MASKKYRDKTCVYCGRDRASSTGDHVVAREFCPRAARDNLPKVPACVACNNAKSKLEHYVLAVLPMGSLLAGSATAIIDQVGPRLVKNEALRRQLAVGQQTRWIRTADGQWHESLMLPFDTIKLSELTCYIALGLAWHHWQTQLVPNAPVRASLFSSSGLQLFEQAISTQAPSARAEGSFGDGVFVYRGVRDHANPATTWWQMTFFGGVEHRARQWQGQTAHSVFVATSDDPAWVAQYEERQAGSGR